MQSYGFCLFRRSRRVLPWAGGIFVPVTLVRVVSRLSSLGGPLHTARARRAGAALGVLEVL